LDTLTPEEWIKPEHIHEVLQAFQEETLATEERLVTLEIVLPTMDHFLNHLEQQKKLSLPSSTKEFVRYTIFVTHPPHFSQCIPLKSRHGNRAP
jgi:hypothetical protein